MSGDRFGRLVALRPAGKIRGETAWLCRCDCGAKRRVPVGALRSLNTRSCGCSRRRPRKLEMLPATVRGARWVPLFPSGFALVDKQHYARVMVYAWRLTRKGYAVTSVPHGKGRTTYAALHRFVLRLPRGVGLVDHKNRDRLDCRRRNLRCVSPTQSAQNRREAKKDGVQPCGQGWSVEIQARRTRVRLGFFRSASTAARTYRQLRALLHYRGGKR